MNRTILFDLDGVIVDSMPAHAEAWQLTFAQVLRVQIPEDIIYQVEGKPNKDVITDVMSVTESDKLIDEDLLLRLNEAKNKIFGRIFKISAIPGAIELIKILFNMGYQMGVATGSNKDLAEEMLTLLAVRSYFTDIVCGEEVTNGKPDPEPYLTLLRKLNGEKQHALVIENAPLGVQSARAAGLICLAVASNNSKSVLKDATLVFDDLKEMQKFFENEYRLTSGLGVWQVDGKVKI